MIITVSFEEHDDIEFKVDEEDGAKLVTAVYVYKDAGGGFKLIDWIDVQHHPRG